MVYARWHRSVTTAMWAGVAVGLLAGCTSGASDPGAGAAPTTPALLTPPLTTIDPSATNDPQPINWQQAVRVDDRTLDVHYVGNAAGCRRLANVRIAESAATVTITLFEGADPARAQEVCPGAGVNARTRVPLESPLADRRVIDGGATPPAERAVR